VEGRMKLDGSTALSFSYLSLPIRETRVHQQIAHDWTMSTKSTFTLKALIQSMLDKGLLHPCLTSTTQIITNTLAGDVSKEPTRKQEWISGSAILVLVDGLLRNAILHGTASWDLRIAEAMSLAVQSATGMRSGDLARSNGYSNQQITKLSDLFIKVVDDDKGVRFQGLLTLRYTQGHKYVSALDQNKTPPTSTTGTMAPEPTLRLDAILSCPSTEMINVGSLTAAMECMYILFQCTELL
jgi:hypothetical protein